MIAVIDYGLGNLQSVAGAVERLGHEVALTGDPKCLEVADKLILPGVGAFGDGMQNLRDRGLTSVLHDLVCGHQRPILGICLGFQLMAQESSEFGQHQGLGWLDASVTKIDVAGGLKLPHVGWNDLFQVRENPLLDDVPADALFYYVHSFQVCCRSQEDVIGESEYGGRVTAAVARGNVYGTQFHPEKSQQWGLKLLANFLEKC